MANVFSHCWRVLLIAALVLNPIAGASAAMGHGESGDAATADMPPCQEMAVQSDHHPAPPQGGEPAQHGCDCGNPACQFAACCIVGVFGVPALPFAVPGFSGTQPLPLLDVAAAPEPPPARMIRPPIA